MRRTVDVEAFVVQHEGPPLRTAYLLAGDQRGAEELLTTALARGYRPHWPWSLRRDGGGDPVSAVRRAMVRTLLRREHRPAPHRPADAAWPTDGAGPPPDHGSEELRRALLGLPARTRAALVLRLHDALTEQQTADVLGCSPGAVAALTEEARAALHGLDLSGPPAPVTAAPTMPRGASPQPDDDAIYRRPQ